MNILNIKKQVKITLIKRNWSQRELARRMGISAPYLQDILAGNRNPDNHIKQMEQLLEINLRSKERIN